MQKAEERRHEETGLYSTFLDPSDDPVPYPFLIYDNALLQRAFAYLAGLQQQKRWQHPLDFREAAERLYRAIRRHGTVEGLGPMLPGRWTPGPSALRQPPAACSCFPLRLRSRMIQYRNTVAWIARPQSLFPPGSFQRDRLPLPQTLAPPAANDLLALNRGSPSRPGAWTTLLRNGRIP